MVARNVASRLVKLEAQRKRPDEILLVSGESPVTLEVGGLWDAIEPFAPTAMLSRGERRQG